MVIVNENFINALLQNLLRNNHHSFNAFRKFLGHIILLIVIRTVPSLCVGTLKVQLHKFLFPSSIKMGNMVIG